MFRKRRWGWIGVDLGTRAVKIAQVERPGGRWRIAHALVLHELDRNPLEELALSDEWLVQALRGRLAGGELRGRRAACVLSFDRTDLRTLDLPDGTADERRSMVAQELEATEGGAGAVSFDFWDAPAALGARREATVRPVQVMSLAADLADRVAEALHRCGLECELLDGLPMALSRAAAMMPRFEESPRHSVAGRPPRSGGDTSESTGPVAMLDWGATTATLTVTDGTGPLFTRELRGCGLEPLVQSLVRGLSLTPDEARQFLAEYGFPPQAASSTPRADLQHLAADLTAGPIRQLTDEIQKTLNYLKQQRAPFLPQGICLTGGGATVANAAPYLSARTGLRVEIWQPSGARPEQRTGGVPEALLAPAAALSALAWES